MTRNRRLGASSVSEAAPLVDYLAAVERELQSGVATEHTYRPALKQLVERLGDAHATNEPKRSACGAPDYSVWRPTGHGPMTLGYIEAKDVGVPLGPIEDSEQIHRYLAALTNLVLTDYLEFRWYVDGQWRRTETLGVRSVDGQVRRRHGGSEEVFALLHDFLAHEPARITKPEELAQRMARLTRLIRDVIVQSFGHDLASHTITDLRHAFEEVLIPHLTVGEFADMFAQTVTYGLFAARVNHSGSERFQRRNAAYEIPRTNPFLRRLFAAITGPELDDEPYVGLVDDLAQLLAASDIDAVLSSFGAHSGRNDPVIHFYETFLAAYDPAVREMRGVYYTPQPVVSYIVGSVDRVLRDRFGCHEGLAEAARPDRNTSATPPSGQPVSPQVLILDPACGTGTFLYSIVDRIRKQFFERDDAGKWATYVRDQLMPRLFGFELLVAPYAVAHLKLGMQLAAQDLPESERTDWAYDLEGSERLGVYLTNTLEEALKKSELLLGSYIAEEANAAADIKRELPILVVVGNPPYSGHSANKGPWIRDLVADYAQERPGLPKPAQGKWLQDDYIKFIRFGEWRIERTGAGVLAFITNHSYVDSPTFAGMRQHLMDTFSDIYVLDLHGNAKKGERTPDGQVDQNVFDIQQGVAISLFVKQPGKTGPAAVHHADLYGKRATKYEWLETQDLETTAWTDVTPSAPFYLFVPQDLELGEEYGEGWSLADIMNGNGRPAPGIVTTHDQFAISRTKDEARSKVRRLVETDTEEQAREIWRLCRQSQWSYERAKRELASGDWEQAIRPVLYRPFDVRWTVFDPNVAVHRRERVTDHLHSGPNLALVTSKMTKGESFAHAQVTRIAPEAICMSPKTSNNGFVFPLYLYASGGTKQRRLLIEGEATGRQANLNPAFVVELEGRLGLSFIPDGEGDLETTFGPNDVFRYIYATLHAPGYRLRYVEFLRHDFPRIQLPPDREIFNAFVVKGKQLVDLHLLEVDPPRLALNFPIPGSNVVATGHPRYLGPGDRDPSGEGTVDAGRVYISKDDQKAGVRGQYFRGIAPEVWSFRVGGYRVCEKWLKDRRGETLTLSDIQQYERIVAVLAQTITIMFELDDIVPEWPMAAEPVAPMLSPGLASAGINPSPE